VKGENTANAKQATGGNPFRRATANIFTAVKFVFSFLNRSRKRFFNLIKKVLFRYVPYLERRVWHAKAIRKFIKYSFNIVVSILIYFFAVSINFLWLFGSSPNISTDKDPEMSIGSELYTSDGVLIGKYYKENRVPVEYGEISRNIVNALIATEDARFFEHSGIDVKATFSVFWYMAKGDQRGGSTITQQLAKNL
jgi:membrane peptidoglycan carboxypeptidase